MKGIDIYQGERKSGTTLKDIPEKAYKESDFVIVKATQGASYKYVPFFHAMIKRCIADGKLIGAYHYAAGNDPIKEADYFVRVVKPYIGKILLCLDWESYQNKAWGSKIWAKRFIDRVKEKTGVTCILYTGTDGCNQCSNLIGKVALWFAGYPKPQKLNWSVPTFKYNLGKWGNYAIWQYTSSGEKVDRNTTSWTAADWKRQASVAAQRAEEKPATPTLKAYTGTFPTLPSRGYFQLNDGIKELTNKRDQIKNLQKALNWALKGGSGFEELTIDGKYGKRTRDAVVLYQKVYKLKVDGLWGKQCNEKLKTIKK